MSPVSSADLSIMASPAGSELSSLTYSAVLQQPGEWQLAKGRSKPDKSRIRAERGTGEPMTLRGVKPERSVALYVKKLSSERRRVR